MSQSADLLALLSDGRPHEMRAIHRAIGFCRLNSRVSELRDRGYRIECDKTGGQYVYTLVSRPLAESQEKASSVSSDGLTRRDRTVVEAATCDSASGCVSGVLPDNDRVDTNVQSPAPLDSQGSRVQLPPMLLSHGKPVTETGRLLIESQRASPSLSFQAGSSHSDGQRNERAFWDASRVGGRGDTSHRGSSG